MSAEQENALRRPGRPKRDEVTQQERRRRKGGHNSSIFDIPAEIKAKYPDKEFRHAVDQGGRMAKLTVNDDWDKVPGVDTFHAGTDEAGKPTKYHLLMKDKEYAAQDRAEKEDNRKKQEQSQLQRPDAKQATSAGRDSYAVPGNQL